MKKFFKNLKKYKILQRKLPLVLAALGLVIAGAAFLTLRQNTEKAEAGWYSSGGTWSHRKQIVIDNTKVSGASTLSSFAMMFNTTDSDLKFTSSGGGVGKSDGTDILFTSSDGVTKLSHELTYYASTTGEVIAWVKIPSLSATVDTTIYIYYGNASASNQQDVTGTWNSNYVGVYHMNEDPSGAAPQVLDSTSNNYDLTSAGTMTSADLVAGKFDSAIDYDGVDDKLTNGSVTGVTGYPVTVSGWSQATTGDNGTIRNVAGIGSSTANGDYAATGWSSTTGNARAAVRTGGSFDTLASSLIGLNTWTYTVAVFRSATDREFYVNGVSVGTDTVSRVAPTFSALAVGGAYGGTSVFAKIDEARILKSALSVDWIKTEYNNQNSVSTFYTYVTGGGGDNPPPGLIKLAPATTSGVGWYNSSWSYRKQITIDSNKVSGASALSSFPILFSVTDSDLKFTGSGGKVASSTGADILFTASDGTTKLSHEIEKYSSSTGETIAWVKIPSLSATSDTTIYIYYGNASATDQQDTSNVWDTNYKGVWHLGEGYSTNANFYKDSTSNANHGQLIDINGNTAQGTGIIGNSVNLNGDADYISTASNLFDPSTTNFSASTWIKVDNVSTNRNVMSQTNGTGQGRTWIVCVSSGSGLIYSGLGGVGSYDTEQCSTTSWSYIVLTLTGSTLEVYLDGVLAFTNTITVESTTDGVHNFGANSVNSSFFDGNIDEYRVSNITRSADWIATEYNNQFSPSTFYAYSASQTESRQDSSGNPAPAIKSRGGVKFR